MSTPHQRQAAPRQTDPPRREPIWFIVMWVCFSGFMAWQQAYFLEQYGFSWLRMAGIIVFAVVAGLWLGELPPYRRLMAWRVHRFGGVASRGR